MNKSTLQLSNSNESQITTFNYEQKSFNSFDLAKFICSILVVMIHYAPFGRYQENRIPMLLNFFTSNGLCRIAVPLFFILSGFLLYRKSQLNNFKLGPAKKYMLRTLILYIAWSIIYLPLSFANILKKTDLSSGVITYIRNLFLTGSYTHLWYLNALLLSVGLTSFLLYKNWSPKKILSLASISYIIGLLGDGYYGIIAPLLKLPVLGHALSAYFMIFTTTRNGLFFAFFFVSLGMYLSKTPISVSPKKSLILFMTSWLLVPVESFLLMKSGISRDCNILLFTVPSALFCFLFLKELNLKDNHIYGYMRKLSSLIYYGHIWVGYLLPMIFRLFGADLKTSPFLFISVLSVTFLISIITIRLSEIKQLSWIKRFY